MTCYRYKGIFASALLIVQCLSLWGTCDSLVYEGEIAIGRDATLITDHIQATKAISAYRAQVEPGHPDYERWFLEKHFSGSFYDDYCEGYADHPDYYESRTYRGSFIFKIDENGNIVYDNDKSLVVLTKVMPHTVDYFHYTQPNFHVGPSGSLGRSDNYYNVSLTPTVRTVTGTADCEYRNITGTVTETLRSEYTRAMLISDIPKSLPEYEGFQEPLDLGGYAQLYIDDIWGQIRRAKYIWHLSSPVIEGDEAILSWIERSIPDDGGDYIDVGKFTILNESSQQSEIYELIEPDRPGWKVIVLDTFTATFDLCPAGSYELEFTYYNSSGVEIDVNLDERKDNVYVSDVSKPYIHVKELPQGIIQASQIKAVARLLQSGQVGDDDGGSASSVSWSVYMGGYENGRSAGAIRLYQEELSADSYTPAALSYSLTGEPGIDVIRDSSGELRQVFAPQALADIVTDTDYYEIRFYHPNDVDGFDEQAELYTLSIGASAFSVWRIDNPSPGTMTQIRMRQMAGPSVERLFTHDPVTDKWTLASGGGLRTLSRDSDVSGDTRVRTTVVSDTVYGNVTKTVETYYTYPWGEELMEEVRDPDGVARKTVWDYYNDDDNDGWRYGKLKSRIDPTGHWEVYDYDALGRTTKTVSSWKGSEIAQVANESLHRVQRISYWEEDLDSDGKREEIQSTVEEIEGQEVARRYRVAWGHSFQEPDPSWEPGMAYKPPLRLKSVSNIRVGTPDGDPVPDAAGNLTTTTHTYVSGPWEGKTRRVLHPNGTVTLYDYSRDAAGNLTTAVYHGAPDGSGEFVDRIAAGRVTITKVDSAGNTISEIERDFQELDLRLTTISEPGGGMLPEPGVDIPSSGNNIVHVARDSEGSLQFRVFDRTGQMIADDTEGAIIAGNDEINSLQDQIDSLLVLLDPQDPNEDLLDHIANLQDQIHQLHQDLIGNLKDDLDLLWNENNLTAVQKRELVSAVTSLLGLSDVENGVTLSIREVENADDFGRPLLVSYPLDGTAESFLYGDYGETASHTGRDGIVTTSTPDALGRVYRTTRNGITEEFSLDGEGRQRKVTRIGRDTSALVLQESHYNLAGELTWSKDAAAETTLRGRSRFPDRPLETDSVLSR